MRKKVSILFIFLGVMFVFLGCEPIINMMAFHPDTRNVLSKDQLPNNVREVFIKTEDNLKIQSYFLPDKSSDKLLIYYHGNAGNISQRMSDLLEIRKSGINVLGAGYRGYGKSQGVPNEKGIYIDGKGTLNYAIRTLGFPLNKVIILGRSIGTTVAVNTSQHKKINKMILVTPLTSGKDHANSIGLGGFSFLAGDSFNCHKT